MDIFEELNASYTDLRREESFIQTSDGRWICKICPGSRRPLYLSRAIEHEDSRQHVEQVREIELAEHIHRSSSPQSDSPVPEASQLPDAEDHDFGHFFAVSGPAIEGDDPSAIYDDYGGVWGRSLMAKGNAALSAVATDTTTDNHTIPEDLDAYNDDQLSKSSRATPGSDDEYSLQSDEEVEVMDDVFPSAGESMSENRPESNYVNRVEDLDAKWWPWKNKEEALLDIMSAFPRSVFSEPELEACAWFAAKVGAKDLPSVRQAKRHGKSVTDLCGANLVTTTGKQGNVFSYLDISSILAHEMANPLLRPHLQFYPEYAGEKCDHASHAAKWRREIKGEFGSPMVRQEIPDGYKDYYVNEPALAVLSKDSYGAVLPTRWYLQDGKMWAKAQLLKNHPGPSTSCLVIDSREESCLDIPLDHFLANYVELCATYREHDLVSPSDIRGIVREGENWTVEELIIEDYTITAPNPLRAKANGRRVLSLPLWLYCDDTSGNSSKKWNKHNSILFTLAGLPAEVVHLLYNIHFICTSNNAPPLEMLNEIINSLKQAREISIEAFDCLYREVVLIIPWILAILGDNPMASEFASHIGLTGKCFCRVCKVQKGAETSKQTEDDNQERERIGAFLKCGSPRNEEDTMKALQEQLECFLRAAPSTADSKQTASGVKDKYFQHFADELAAECARLKEQMKGDHSIDLEDIKAILADLRNKMPENIFNPIFGLEELDVNADTPVELLHVILLGFVKYFWRDAVSRQDSQGKEALKARINGFDTSGLGLPRARGHTLVQYAGSLTGRDFRLILQMAPSILHGLIPEAHYKGWLALCRLAPLAYQPKISEIDSYLSRLRGAVDDFLAATALWSTRWFNKPKFHILLHLPLHVERFGPAIFFATESFEGFNFVIRARSIHSNRQAPSLDIGSAFSHLHAVRHLISGGYVNDKATGNFRQAGESVIELIKDSTFLRLMSMDSLTPSSRTGSYKYEAYASEQAFEETLTSRTLIGQKIVDTGNPKKVRRCSSVIIQSGDAAKVDGFALYQKETCSRIIGRIREILVDSTQVPPKMLGALVMPYTTGSQPVYPYQFPSVRPSANAESVWLRIEDFLCTLSTIHNCAANECKPQVVQTTRMERQNIRKKGIELQHVNAPDDLLLNLAQMRNAVYIQPFQPDTQYPELSRDELIEKAIQNRHDLDMEKEKAEQEKTARKAATARKKKSSSGKRKAVPDSRETDNGVRSSKRTQVFEHPGTSEARLMHADYAAVETSFGQYSSYPYPQGSSSYMHPSYDPQQYVPIYQGNYAPHSLSGFPQQGQYRYVSQTGHSQQIHPFNHSFPESNDESMN